MFSFLRKKVITNPSDRAKFDFIVKDDDGKKIGIEVKRQNVTPQTFVKIKSALTEYEDLEAFYLITPEEPPAGLLGKFIHIFKDEKFPVYWLGINQFIEQQELGIELTQDFRTALIDLQVAAITSNFEDYSKDHVGSDIATIDLKAHLKKTFDNVREGKSVKSNFLFGLRRQFPYNTISKLEKEPTKVADTLGFGQKYDQAIIVLTDIKSFSSLVSVSDPDELNDLMNKFYINARNLVFEYDGILDKFIGDAVLAIFNYPFRKQNSYANATKFCSELILMTENILNDFQRSLDQKIETGTRVGIATGSIYALNIGIDEYEITFIGDKINLAARLEKNCEVNGMLMSNKFYYKLVDNDPDLIESIAPKAKEIDPKNAKGQSQPIKAWQVQRADIEIT